MTFFAEFVCICSDSEGYLKTPALVLCMNLHIHARDRKISVFLHRQTVNL